MSDHDSSQRKDGIVKVSVRPEKGHDDVSRREAFGSFWELLGRALGHSLELADAYVGAELTRKNGDAANAIQGAAEIAAQAQKVLAESSREQQMAVKQWLANMKDASAIDDEELRDEAIEQVRKTSPQISEQFDIIQNKLKDLCLFHNVKAGRAPIRSAIEGS